MKNKVAAEIAQSWCVEYKRQKKNETAMTWGALSMAFRGEKDPSITQKLDGLILNLERKTRYSIKDILATGVKISEKSLQNLDYIRSQESFMLKALYDLRLERTGVPPRKTYVYR